MSVSSKGTVVFVEQFYYPDGWGGTQLPRDITTHLVMNGWDVTVVCGSDPYAPVVGDPGEDPSNSGVRIRRIPRLIRGDIHRLKLFRQLWFYLACVIPLLTSRVDIYISQTNPPLVVFIVAVLAALRRKPFIIIAQDLYPEVMIAHGLLRRDAWGGKFFSALFGWSYRRADAVVSLGPTMSARLAEKKVEPARIEEISNWATGDACIVRGELNGLRTSWSLDDRFVALYSGNIGVGHDVETLLRAARAVREVEPAFALVLIGRGYRLEEAKRLARELRIEDCVVFRDFVPAELLPHALGLADVALVTLRPGFEGVIVPSKLLGYMARGIPTFYVGPSSDVEHYLTESGGGLVFRNHDVEGLANALIAATRQRSLMPSYGRAAQSYYEQHLDRAAGLAKYARLIRRIVAREVP